MPAEHSDPPDKRLRNYRTQVLFDGSYNLGAKPLNSILNNKTQLGFEEHHETIKSDDDPFRQPGAILLVSFIL